MTKLPLGTKIPLNLPNKITLGRILLIPLYLLLMALVDLPANWPAAIVFLIAAGSDWVDGYIARKHDMITDFGKFMDPIADKLLVLLPMIYFSGIGGAIDVWAVMLIAAREIVVSGFRLVAVTKGTVIAAGWTGKVKTSVQMLAVLLLTLGLDTAGWWTTWIAALLTLYSGAEILYRNRHVLEEPV